MNKVTTVNLGGTAYQLEEPAYDALRAYLSEAEAKLAGNPDKEEIVKDLEQAIGIKCSAYVNAHKNVLTQSEVATVLAEMGPVEGEEAAASAGTANTSSASPKRLYRLKEGSIVFGVCTGLAAYFGVDVALVRLLVIVLAFITGGGFLFVYFLAMVFIPEAGTPAEEARAYGSVPLTAQDLVNRAKESIDQFKNSGQWEEWKKQGQEWKNHARAQKRYWKEESKKYKHQSHAWQQYAKQNRSKSFLSELNEFVWSMFGLFVVIFFIWIVYHHVPLVQHFLDSLRSTWDWFIASLAQALGR